MRITKKLRLFSLFFLTILFLQGLHAQNTSVRGLVTDAKGEALIGVNVTEVGNANNGTITDINGVFTLNVPSQGQIQVSYLGYKTEVVSVNGRTNINVRLSEDNQLLDEVIVIGYGNQRREAVTGSVASIKGDVMRDVPATNITGALQGRVAGVEMSQTSSKPGAGMQIRIRGTRSLTASNDPLVVLDGIPFAGSISDINPSDIRSVDILKDASATAIYGSRGANGVILVTTNKGQQGQKATVTYNQYTGVKTLFARYPMMDNKEFVALRAAAGMFNNSLDEDDNVNTDWQSLLFDNAMVTSHDMSVSGGTENTNYNFGVGYYQDQALLPGQDYSRYSMRGSLDQQIGRHIKIGFTSNSNFSVNNGNNLGLYNVLSMSPIANPYNEDGSLKRTIKMPLDEQFVTTRSVVEGLGDSWIDQTKAFGSYNTVYAEAKIPGVEGLKYRVNLGANFRMSNGGSFNGLGVFNVNPTTVSTASISNSLTTNWAIENMITYDRVFADKHQVNAVVLYSAEETMYNRSHVSARDIPATAFQFYNLGHAAGEISVNPNNQDYQRSALVSLMARAMYSYDNKYMISATLRRDGSSRLATGNKYHTYPAISAGWNIKNEDFMSDVSFLNMLKIRAGYGQTSNQAVSPYATLGRLSTRPYNFGNDYYDTGFYVSELPNDNLGWEYSITKNYAVEFSMFNSRLSGTLEHYVTDTKDLLLRVNLPSTAGVGSYVANVGETQNKGYELSLDGVIIDNKNGWTWEAGLNFYSNRNKIVALASGREKDESNWWFVGQPVNVIYDYEKIGLWQEGDPFLTKYEPGGNVGMIRVKYTGEFNEDGSPVRQIGPDDRQVLKVDPNFQGGFNTRVAYKNIDLNIVGAFQGGGTLISTLYSSSGYLNMLSGRRGNVKVDYWTPENTNAKYPKPGGVASNDNPKYGSTLGYFDASFLKIRTISLGYNFDQKWIKDAGFSRLRIYGTVQNPFVMFSPYNRESGMDPETNSYGDENSAVTTTYQRRLLTLGTSSPATRNYVFGINLTF